MPASLQDYFSKRRVPQLELVPGVTTPLHFGDPQAEHLATRRSCGLFDFSFMACVEITGPDAPQFVDYLQTRSLSGIPPGRIAYTLLLRDDGTVLNDATVWRHADVRYWLFTGRHGDLDHVRGLASGFAVRLHDRSREHAVIAVQGPSAREVISACLQVRPSTGTPYYGFGAARIAGTECWLAGIGYSGEMGYELIASAEAAPELWGALVAGGRNFGLVECGFAAADSLRIEAGHILFTRELAVPVTPFELGLARLVDFHRPPFHGAGALRARRWLEPARRLVGLLPAADAAPDQSLPERIAPGAAVLTSARWSPLFERCLGLGFVAADDAHPGATVRLSGALRARVARLPFYDPAKLLRRRTRWTLIQ